MKFIFLLLSFFTATLHGQSVLNFDKRYVECEDKWVAFSKGKDSTFSFGFIYIDAQAGLTLNYEGNFTISDNGTFIVKKNDKTNLKVRLNPNQVKVAFIPENKFGELQIPATPEWLKYYKTDSNSIERLYRWGFLYNGYNECAKALTYLEKAQKINPKFKGLSVEIAFSYNCLNQFDKAIIVLQNALKENPTDAYLYKELIYSQVRSGKLDKAAENCKNAIKACTDTTYNGENCYNLLHSYYEKKDKTNFNLWLTETKKWSAANARMTGNIQKMEEEMAK